MSPRPECRPEPAIRHPVGPGTVTERKANSAEAVAVAERLNDPLVRFYAYHWRAYGCVEAGEVLAARSWGETRAGHRRAVPRAHQPVAPARRRREPGDHCRRPRRRRCARTDGARRWPQERARRYGLLCGPAGLDRIRARHAWGVGAGARRGGAQDAGRAGVPSDARPGAARGGRRRMRTGCSRQAVASSFPDTPYDIAWLTAACIYAYVAAGSTIQPRPRSCTGRLSHSASRSRFRRSACGGRSAVSRTARARARRSRRRRAPPPASRTYRDPAGAPNLGDTRGQPAGRAGRAGAMTHAASDHDGPTKVAVLGGGLRRACGGMGT